MVSRCAWILQSRALPLRTSWQGIASFCAEASVVEEPDAEKSHAGIRAKGCRAIGLPYCDQVNNILLVQFCVTRAT